MARRPTPIVIQSPQRKSDVSQFGQLLGSIGQLGQQFKQRQQRQALEQRAVQETGISPETAKLADTETLITRLTGKKTREASAAKFIELTEKLRPQVTTKPSEPTETPPITDITQPIQLGRGVTREVTPARPLEALGGLAAEGFITPQRVGTSLERLGLLPSGAPTAETPFTKIAAKDFTSDSIKVFQTQGATDFSLLVPREETLETSISGLDKIRSEDLLRNDFLNLSKDFITKRDATSQIEASAQDPSAAGDISLIFSFMKLLDPTSVVREGEQATAASARGVPEATRTLYNRVLTGERLGVEQRADFVDRSKKLFKSTERQHNQRVKTFNGVADRSGLDKRNITVDLSIAILPVDIDSAGIPVF